MFKKLFMLFKIGRKLSTSGAISSIYEIYSPPIAIKIGNWSLIQSFLKSFDVCDPRKPYKNQGYSKKH